MKTFIIKTFGCKVNQYESQAIREKLLQDGYKEVSERDSPDLCIINTCCVTQTAERKSRQYVNHIRRTCPSSQLFVTGCSVDYNPGSYGSVTLVPNEKKYQYMGQGISSFHSHTRAFVKVQDGCNQFCSYCLLPYVRGRSRSRPLEDVLEEVRRLVSNGYHEVVLTGIHLGDYKDLPRLLSELSKFPDLLRIRLSSLEPQDITQDFLNVILRNPKICRHFHIPLQSGSDRILERMNRRYRYTEYRKLIEDIREKVPEVSFTTDLIVGFPGETQEDFLATCHAVEEIGFAKVHIFPYSNRPGTTASRFPDRVPPIVIKRRVGDLLYIADKTSSEVKSRLIGTFQDVLIEGFNRGYTSGYIPIRIDGENNKNQLEGGKPYARSFPSPRLPYLPDSILRRGIPTNRLVRVKIICLDGQFLVGKIST